MTCDVKHPDNLAVVCDRTTDNHPEHTGYDRVRKAYVEWPNADYAEPAKPGREGLRDIKARIPLTEPPAGHRDGKTYDPAFDYHRLNTQMSRVWRALMDKGWHTLAALSEATGDPEASVSARIRDLRKEKFGAHVVQERRVGTGGLREYRLLS